MIRVVKCGGQVLDDDALLEAFCRDFAALEGPKVLVHGGGALAGRFQKALGIEPVKYEGRRVTDAATLQVVTMVYAGWCNKRVVLDDFQDGLLSSLGVVLHIYRITIRFFCKDMHFFEKICII